MILRLSALLLFVMIAGNAFAATFDDLFVDARARSLGLALTAWVDDYSSLYRNPAGLAKHDQVDLHFFNLYGAYTKDVLNAVDSLTSVEGGGESTPAQQLAQLDRLAVGLEARLPSPGLYLKSVAAGLYLADTKVRMRFRTPNPLFANVSLRATSDFGIAFGYGHAMWENKLRWGVAFRPVMVRVGFDRELNSTEIISLFSDEDGLAAIFSPDAAGVGLGLDADFGMQFEVDPLKVHRFGLRPMFGMTVQNAFASTYSVSLSDEFVGVPPPNQRKLNLGMALRLEGVGKFKPTWSLEFRDFLIDADSFLERVCSGVEVLMQPRDWFSTALRAHFYRGNLGGGIGIHLYWAELEFGTYAENLGGAVGVGVDRRYYGQLAGVF